MQYVASDVMVVSKCEGYRMQRSESGRYTVLAYLSVGTEEKCQLLKAVPPAGM